MVGVLWSFRPVNSRRAESHEPVDLRVLVVGVQVEVKPTWLRVGRPHPVKREVWSSPTSR